MVEYLMLVLRSVFSDDVALLIDGKQFKNVKARLRMFLFCDAAQVFSNK
jgi:predicted transcriptional regulator